MFIAITSIWAVLMVRSGIAEYKYYQSVKTLEPNIWEKLGTPVFLNIPLVFLNHKNAQLLTDISNKTVRDLSTKHRQARNQFLSYVLLVLVVSILYFKMA